MMEYTTYPRKVYLQGNIYLQGRHTFEELRALVQQYDRVKSQSTNFKSVKEPSYQIERCIVNTINKIKAKWLN